MAISDVLTDRALLAAVCEDLVPFMNGEKMCHVSLVLDELVVDPSGSLLDGEDQSWFSASVERSLERRAFWDGELRRLDQLGIGVVASVDPAYPVNLTLVHDAPPLLFVDGTLEDRDRRAVAVVGTRVASREGIDLAGVIATDLVAQGYTVVSGLAKGIDAAAHAAALNAGGRTIAVFGTPVETVYPAVHSVLAKQIARSGACVSQFLPGVRTGRWSFPARNLTGSGLSLATVVVEASESSGARHQAQAALRHGKRVFLVESLVTAQPWAQQMESASRNVTVVSDAEMIVKELEADLTVDDDAVFA
ncbi:MAG: DNA-processing protein DprA [Acidimicrobiaceae bacterium]|nr:DNA-processing protein DprA [Acidimicrobiaceae bacterium]